MAARIYQIPRMPCSRERRARVRGCSNSRPPRAKKPDLMTGWAGSGDTREQVKLTFPDADAACAYCERYGISYTVVKTPPKILKIQAYADNFR